jgi:hypothetical protein
MPYDSNTGAWVGPVYDSETREYVGPPQDQPSSAVANLQSPRLISSRFTLGVLAIFVLLVPGLTSLAVMLVRGSTTTGRVVAGWVFVSSLGVVVLLVRAMRDRTREVREAKANFG